MSEESPIDFTDSLDRRKEQIKDVAPGRVNKFLNGREFGKKFKGIFERAYRGPVEQGLVVASSVDRKKLYVDEITSVHLGQAEVDYESFEKRHLVPLAVVHFHTLGPGKEFWEERRPEEMGEAVAGSGSFFPSISDLDNPEELWVTSNFETLRVHSAGALVTASHPARLWLWQRPPKRQFNQALREYRTWFKDLGRTGDATQRDLKELEQILRDNSFKLVTADLGDKNPNKDFARIFKESGIRLGFTS